jgi:hypothetical protein
MHQDIEQRSTLYTTPSFRDLLRRKLLYEYLAGELSVQYKELRSTLEQQEIQFSRQSQPQTSTSCDLKPLNIEYKISYNKEAPSFRRSQPKDAYLVLLRPLIAIFKIGERKLLRRRYIWPK